MCVAVAGKNLIAENGSTVINTRAVIPLLLQGLRPWKQFRKKTNLNNGAKRSPTFLSDCNRLILYCMFLLIQIYLSIYIHFCFENTYEPSLIKIVLDHLSNKLYSPIFLSHNKKILLIILLFII